MPKNAATKFEHVLLEENWSNILSSKTKKETKVSYLMVEEITPPDYMWNRICNELDSNIKKDKKMHNTISNKTIIGLLLGGATLLMAIIMYFLL